MAPKLIQCSRDKKALDMVELERTTASYKLREGLGVVNTKRLVHVLKVSHFSLNLDEYFGNNNKISTILVSYYSELEHEVVVKHFKSQDLPVVNAKILLELVTNSSEDYNIPLSQLICNLSDSTNYMRGKTAGFETLLRREAPHLLDIDGNICHHIHNSVQRFCSYFSMIVESLVDDLHTEFKWCPDIREMFTEPGQRVAHRWLSACPRPKTYP